MLIQRNFVVLSKNLEILQKRVWLCFDQMMIEIIRSLWLRAMRRDRFKAAKLQWIAIHSFAQRSQYKTIFHCIAQRMFINAVLCITFTCINAQPHESQRKAAAKVKDSRWSPHWSPTLLVPTLLVSTLVPTLLVPTLGGKYASEESKPLESCECSDWIQAQLWENWEVLAGFLIGVSY